MACCVLTANGVAENASETVSAWNSAVFDPICGNLRGLYMVFAEGRHSVGLGFVVFVLSGALPLQGVAGSHSQDPINNMEAKCFPT